MITGINYCKDPKDHVCKKIYIWNPATCSYESGKYVGSTIVNLVISVMRL